MTWINVKNQAPPDREIYVFCTKCNAAHSYIPGDWDDVEFEKWMELPQTVTKKDFELGSY